MNSFLTIWPGFVPEFSSSRYRFSDHYPLQYLAETIPNLFWIWQTATYSCHYPPSLSLLFTFGLYDAVCRGAAGGNCCFLVRVNKIVSILLFIAGVNWTNLYRELFSATGGLLISYPVATVWCDFKWGWSGFIVCDKMCKCNGDVINNVLELHNFGAEKIPYILPIQV